MTKYNDEEMAKYAKTFNQLCEKNKITSFWWDTNLLHKAFKKGRWSAQKRTSSVLKGTA